MKSFQYSLTAEDAENAKNSGFNVISSQPPRSPHVHPLLVLLPFALAFISATACAQQKLVKTKVDDNITIYVPQLMIPMTPEDLAQRFPSVRAPLAAFTDMDRAAEFSVNISATRWPDGNIEMAKGFFKSALVNLYDRVDMINEGVIELHKKKFAFYEFESRINGDKYKQGLKDPVLSYTYTQYYVDKKRTLVFTFSCPRAMKDEWVATVHDMMAKVRVK